MRQSVASNFAVLLAVLSWPLACYGVMSQLGDYAPSTPREILAANHHRSVAVLVAGLLCFSSSLWLSGYSFSAAKVRSVVAAVLCLALLSVAIVGMWPW
jgi:hypothetical protein